MAIVQDHQYLNSLVCHRGLVPTRPGGRIGGKARTNYQSLAIRKGSRLCCIYFCSRWYYLSIVQINPFRPSPNHSTTDSQSFRYSV